MNTRKLLKNILVLTCLVAGVSGLNAQPGTLEMTSLSSNTNILGPSVAPVIINFREDIQNLTFGTSFRTDASGLSVTLSLANQQYATTASNMPTGMAFGGGTTGSTGGNTQQSAANLIYNALGATLVQPPQNGMFVSSPVGTIVQNYQNGGRGVGLDPEATQNGRDIDNFNAFDYNFGTTVYTSVEPLWDANLDKAGRYYYGDLVITFNRVVANPVLHFAGLGGSYNFQPVTPGPRIISYFTTELELQSSGPVNTSTFMAGNENFSVVGNKILNSSTTPNGGSYNDNNTQGGFLTYGAATGSVRINGTVTQLVYKVYVRGSANSDFNFSKNQADISGATRDPFNGDLFYVAISLTNAPPGGPVPIKLSTFDVTKNNCTAELNWKTSTEENGDRFEIEAATGNNAIYSNVGSVKAAGNSTTTKSYSYSYTMQAGQTYYFRLKMIDKDGTFKYSEIRSASCSKGTGTDIVIAPNPVKDHFTIRGMESGKNLISIYATNGQLVKTQVITQNQGLVNVNKLSPGLYMVRVTDETGNTVVSKLIKQ